MRILLKLIIFVVIIAVVGLIALPFIVDPNDYKQEIADQVEKVTGRKLTLEGDIGLSVFPWVALELGSLSLSNAEGFEADSFAKADAAEIRIKLIPLFKKQLEMDTIMLDGLVLNLEKNNAGKTNWDDLVDDDESTESSREPDPKSSDSSTVEVADVKIAGIKLTNTSISWSDATTSESYRLENLNLIVDPLTPDEPVTIDIGFDFASPKSQTKAHIQLNTKVTLDLENQRYSLAELNFIARAEGTSLPFSQAEIALNGNIDADMVKQLVAIDGLSLVANASKDRQIIDAKLSAHISADLANQQTRIKGVELTAEVTDPALPGGKAVLNLTTDITGDLQQQNMALSALVIDIHDLLINGDIKASKLLTDNPSFSGHIDIKPFNLRQLADKLSIELPAMADDSTLKLVQVSTDFTGSSKQFNAKQLDVILDQSRLRGQLAVKNFVDPVINFKLALDEIDVDRYSPPVPIERTHANSPPLPKKQIQANAPATVKVATDADKLPLDMLRQINTKGTLDIGKLKISGTHSERIHLEIYAGNGLIKLHPMTANLYHGQYQGNIRMDARSDLLKLGIDENLKAVQAGPLLKDLTGDDMISGVANAKIKLNGKGDTVDQIKQTLTGSGRFSFTDGAVKGFNIAESIRIATATLKGETLPPSETPLQTDFSSLTGSFTASKGIIINRDLLVKSPLLRINGAGTIDLPKEGIEYGLKVSIVGTSKGQGGRNLSELEGLTIPVKITGSFDNPKPTVDLANLIRDQASQEVKDKVADKLKDELGDELGGLLGSALGTESNITPPPPEKETTDSTSESGEQRKPAKAPEEQLEDALKSRFKGLF